MKKLLLIALVSLTVFAVYAQSILTPDPEVIGADSASFSLREVSIDKFEREGSWNVKISPDNGVISGKFFEGGPDPIAKDPNSDGTAADDDTRAFGVKAEFFRRGVNSFYITPAQPLAIDGVTKTISVWVAGRNQPHKISVLLSDFFGNQYELYMGKLDYTGWKELVVAVPPSPDGTKGIVQTSAYYGERPGLTIRGFRIDCDPVFATGSYYVYFDDLSVVTDLYAFENSDPYDMSDDW